MQKILLKARNIEHAYEEGSIKTPVLRGINLDIEASKMTAIVGRSGSGKSTLLHILGTLDTPTKGDMYFQDVHINALNPKEKALFRNRHLGFIYQFHHLLGDFSALENVMMPLLIDHIDRRLARDRAMYLLERVGLEQKKDHLPSELSGGERQRVAIARALVHSPELVLADEPTGNLDEKNANLVFAMFKELVIAEGSAVVMVSHDISLAKQCDNVFEIVNGLIYERNGAEFDYDLHPSHSESGSEVKTEAAEKATAASSQAPVSAPNNSNSDLVEELKADDSGMSKPIFSLDFGLSSAALSGSSHASSSTRNTQMDNSFSKVHIHGTDEHAELVNTAATGVDIAAANERMAQELKQNNSPFAEEQVKVHSSENENGDEEVHISWSSNQKDFVNARIQEWNLKDYESSQGELVSVTGQRSRYLESDTPRSIGQELRDHLSIQRAQVEQNRSIEAGNLQAAVNPEADKPKAGFVLFDDVEHSAEVAAATKSYLSESEAALAALVAATPASGSVPAASTPAQDLDASGSASVSTSVSTSGSSGAATHKVVIFGEHD